MAILESIRERKIFLIITVGLALFAFVVSGLFDSGFQTTEQNIGSVNGEDMPYKPFAEQVEMVSRNNAGGNFTLMQIVNTLWEQAVQAKILNQQFEQLGIAVGKDQVLALAEQSYGNDPEFQNDKGAFDPVAFARFILDLETSNPQAYAQWQMQEASIVETSKRNIYLSLLRAGLGATATEGELSYHQEADKVDVSYISLPYTSIADSLVKVSDSEIKTYMEKHRKEYERRAERDIQFVTVDEKATQADKDEIRKELISLLANKDRYNSQMGTTEVELGFEKLTQLADIEAFVNRNSDIPFDSLFVAKDKLPVVVADTLMKLPKGGVYGPYEDNNYLKITKKITTNPRAEVKASHILVSYKGAYRAKETVTLTKDEAKVKANRLLDQVKRGGDFSALAKENSDDASNANSAGELNFFTRGQMVSAFENFAFSAKIGEVGVVETDFGFHVVKVTDEKAGVQLATVAKKIEPSEATRSEIFRKIVAFETMVAKEPTRFVALAQQEGYGVLPADKLEEVSESIPGLGDSRSIVRWAFEKDTKIGAVRRFEVNGSYVIAQVVRISSPGLLSVEDGRPSVLPILQKEKKARMLIEKIRGATLEDMAQEAGVSVSSASGISLKDPFLTGVGREPKLIGVAFALPLNKESKPVEGDNGVYVVKTTAKNIAPALDNYGTYIHSLRNLKAGRVSSELFSALQDAAEIKDNRSVFY